MADKLVLWTPWPGFQTLACECGADDALLGGAAGPGKTDILILWGLRFAHKPWFRGLVLRRTLDELGEISERLAAIIPRMFAGAKFSEQKKCWTFPAGGNLRYGYCDRFKDIEQYMGRQYTYIAWDEVGQVPEEKWIVKLMSRLRSPDPEGQQFCFFRASANPGGEGHGWLKRRYILPCGKSGERVVTVVEKLPDGREVKMTRAFVPGRVKDNPILYNDPKYMARLNALPERERKALMDGDWDAAGGLAYEELTWESHSIPDQPIPDYWQHFGGYDWGFAHWAVFVHMAKAPDGTLVTVDTVWMRKLHPEQQAEAIWEQIPIGKLQTIYAGHDCWAVKQSMGVPTPTIADTFAENRIILTHANTDRKMGYRRMNDLLSYRGRGQIQADGTKADRKPLWFFMDTPGNRKLVAQMTELVTDEDNPEDILKVDCDLSSGEGGDDGQDASRHAVATFEPPGKAPLVQLSAFDPIMLKLHVEKTTRVRGQDPYAKKEEVFW